MKEHSTLGTKWLGFTEQNQTKGSIYGGDARIASGTGSYAKYRALGAIVPRHIGVV